MDPGGRRSVQAIIGRASAGARMARKQQMVGMVPARGEGVGVHNGDLDVAGRVRLRPVT